MAKKYFGDKDPIGKSINLDDRFEFVITAIAENVPENSHFHFDFVAPFKRIVDLKYGNLDHWGEWNYFTYLDTL